MSRKCLTFCIYGAEYNNIELGFASFNIVVVFSSIELRTVSISGLHTTLHIQRMKHVRKFSGVCCSIKPHIDLVQVQLLYNNIVLSMLYAEIFPKVRRHNSRPEGESLCFPALGHISAYNMDNTILLLLLL